MKPSKVTWKILNKNIFQNDSLKLLIGGNKKKNISKSILWTKDANVNFISFCSFVKTVLKNCLYKCYLEKLANQNGDLFIVRRFLNNLPSTFETSAINSIYIHILWNQILQISLMLYSALVYAARVTSKLFKFWHFNWCYNF